MSLHVRNSLLACLGMTGAFGVAEPALAQGGDRDALLIQAAGGVGVQLSDADMSGLRGGAGLFGLPFGSSTFLALGSSSTSDFGAGSPSSASSSLTSGGSSLGASASIGPAGAPQTLSFSQTFSTSSSVSTSYSFSFQLKL